MTSDADRQQTPVQRAHLRHAGPGALSLALMDARNHSLQLFTRLEAQRDAKSETKAQALGLSPLFWELGSVGWYQEYWIMRNLQRGAGAGCDPMPTRLASILANADSYFDAQHCSAEGRWRLELPDAEGLRRYLLQVLELNLELLEKSGHRDRDLYFFRLCLQHEDAWFERVCVVAQALGWWLDIAAPAASASREPLLLPASRWTMGWTEPGFALDHELPAHAVDLPAYEIDAQPVNWSQYLEFVAEAGYDRAEFWQSEGWAWLQRCAENEGRRGPRYVEQIGQASGAVAMNRFGRACRMSGSQPVQHVSWWEADAWCRWAGRRLATEVEWEAAALQAARRGFVWGQVLEWTASTFRPYPGYAPGPDRSLSLPWLGRAKAVRGASLATRPRLKHERMRRFLLPDRDDAFIGFRSCAI